METRLSTAKYAIIYDRLGVVSVGYRPVAVMSHFPWNFCILSGIHHLGVPKYIGFICSIDQNMSCVTGKRLYSFNSLRSNHISSDSTHSY